MGIFFHKQLKGYLLGSSWWHQSFHDPGHPISGHRLLSTQNRTSSHSNECEKAWNSLGAVRNYEVDIRSGFVIRWGKERTAFEETNVTIYEQGRGYTFWSSIIVSWSMFLHAHLCCKSGNGRVIHLSFDNRTICLYDDIVLVTILDYFCLLTEGM